MFDHSFFLLLLCSLLIFGLIYFCEDYVEVLVFWEKLFSDGVVLFDVFLCFLLCSLDFDLNWCLALEVLAGYLKMKFAPLAVERLLFPRVLPNGRRIFGGFPGGLLSIL